MPQSVTIRKIHKAFTRHDRTYCIFSVNNSADTFIYFSHISLPLRSVFFGKDFLERIPDLLKNNDLCIECGLGTSIKGGVSLDGEDCIAFNYSVRDANRIISCLKDYLGNEGSWIELFTIDLK